MSNAQAAGARARAFLLVLAVICWLAGIFWVVDVAWPDMKLPGNLEPMGLQGVAGWTADSVGIYLAVAGVFFGLFLVTQWFFLGPRGKWRVRLNESGRPLRASVIVAGLLAGILTLALLASLAELTGVWEKMMGGDNARWIIWPLLGALVLAWLIWAVIFFCYWRQGNRGTQLSRLLRGLFAGSILELLVATPVQVMALRSSKDDNDCYCATGSYTGLILGGTVLLWTFGPGLVLMFLREKDRREPLLTKVPR